MAFLGNLRNLQTGLVRQLANGIHKRQIVGFHFKLDNVTVRTAAETMIKTFGFVHRKRRRLFVVKRATGLVFAPFAHQLYL